jgi:hypothetical protein
MTPLKQEEAKKLLLKEMIFVIHKEQPPTKSVNPIKQTPVQNATASRHNLSRKMNKSRATTVIAGDPQQPLYREEQVLPLVVREISALAKQHIKIREPTDFLKIQQRIKNDLEGMNHSNAFFRQRYSAYLGSLTASNPFSEQKTLADHSTIMKAPVAATSPTTRISSSLMCYRPKPFIDNRGGCLANYDEYLIMRDMDRSNKQQLRTYLMDQIK